MPESVTFDKSRSVVLIMDFTKGIVQGYSTDPAGVVERAARVLKTAREKGVPVIHVIPPSNGAPESSIHPGVAPVGSERVLTKTVIGAFSTTGLDVMLRQQGKDTVILLGVATSGCVLSTTRWAFDIGYKVFVVADACSDPDPQIHQALTDQKSHASSWIGLWRLGTMISTKDFQQALASV